MPEEWYERAFFNRRFLFRFGDCDKEGRASLYALMKLISELSGEDYERRGLGHELLASRGQAFLLARMRLSFKRLPLHTETVVARTWERCTKGPFFYRDYEISTESGEVIVSGASHWFMVDIISREILRPDALPDRGRQLDERRSDCPYSSKLKKRNDLPVLGRRPVYYSDLDANGHVNNAVYARIAVDYLPDDVRRRDIKDFSINYFMETKPGETLLIEGTETDKGFALQGNSGGTAHFGCEFGF